jgi:hypothetical protein
MQRRTIIHLLVACALFGALPAEVFAELSIELSNAQLTAASEVIVIGRATSSQSRWVDRTLVTAVNVQITESLKGAIGGFVEVLLPGGIDAARRIPVAMTYPGAPTMQPGEEVFLFLNYADDVSGYVVSGFAQGKFSIISDATGVQRVSRDLRGSQLIEGAGISRGTVTLAALSAFRQEILGYVGR